jgi:hypothetical protein
MHGPCHRIDLAPEQLLGYEHFSNEVKLAYVKLNIPMPCPPRGTVPVNTMARFSESVSTQHAQFAFGQSLCENSFLDHRIRLLISSKSSLSKI